MSVILIVDDNPLQLDQLKSILNKAGYPIAGVASSGTEVVKLLRSIHPSLVTLDIVMPDMNGLDLLRSIRAAYPSIPVMVCSSFGNEVVADLARRSGVFAFFPKPYPTHSLLQEVERMIGLPNIQVPDLS